MKIKRIIFTLASLILLTPFISKADDKLEDIKDIRGEKNHFEDLMLDNGNMYIDESEMKENNIHIKTNKNNKKVDPIIKELKDKTFTFKSGTGDWETNLKFKDDKGNFEVVYRDVDDDRTYISKAVGRFSLDKKVNNTSYILNLNDFKVTSPTGKEEKNGNELIEYFKNPYGMESKDENKPSEKFTLYLPHRKRSEMSDPLNEWINKLKDLKHIDKNESRVFIIVNNDNYYPFIENVK